MLFHLPRSVLRLANDGRLCLNDNSAHDARTMFTETPGGNKTIREIEPPLHLNGGKKFQHKRIFGCKKKVGTNLYQDFKERPAPCRNSCVADPSSWLSDRLHGPVTPSRKTGPLRVRL